MKTATTDVPVVVAARVSWPASRRFVMVTLAKARFVVSGSAAAMTGSRTTDGPFSVNVGEAPPGVSTGASLTGTTETEVLARLLLAVPSLTRKDTARGVGLGFWEVFRYVTVRRTVW